MDRSFCVILCMIYYYSYWLQILVFLSDVLCIMIKGGIVAHWVMAVNSHLINVCLIMLTLCEWHQVELSDSEKIFRFDFPKRINFFPIWFDSAHHWRIGYYRLLCCQMSTLLRHHESLSQLNKDVGCDIKTTNDVNAGSHSQQQEQSINIT